MEHRGTSLDPEQREAVECDLNAVVTAGAGSGKTTVLAERYVRLIREEKAGVDAILTLTFTRKAAAEMYERIYARLVEESDHPVVAAQLALFDRAQISTLDSFCAQIARNWSEHFGVAKSFTIGETESTLLVEEEALSFILENGSDPALVAFIELNGFEKVWKELFVLLGRSYFTIAEPRDLESMREAQTAALGEMMLALEQKSREILDAILAIEPGGSKAIGGAHELIPRKPAWDSLSHEERVSAIVSLKLSKRTGSSSSENVVMYKELVEELDAGRSALEEASATLASGDLIRRMFALCDQFQGRLLARKRASGVLSFQDVVEMAVRTLVENPAIREHYKRKFRYIMIDEFQDNNDLQKQLLYLLAEDNASSGAGVPPVAQLDHDKLFFVGDEKQSIYRFRGADVSVFKSLSGELGAAGGRLITLSTNYRSEPQIIDFVNRVFPRIMANPQEGFEARFEPVMAGRRGRTGNGAETLQDGKTVTSVPDEGRAAGSVRVFYGAYDPSPPPGAAHSDDAEAHRIARFIADSVRSASLPVAEGDGVRPARFEDFALLMRSTSNQIRYERIFRRFGIPYTTQSVRTLFLEAPLNDIYNLLQLAVYPQDRPAYAALLRSPLVNLSDIATIRVLLDGSAPFGPAPPELGEEDLRKLAAGRRLYEHFSSRADRVSVAELLFDLWYRFGYRYTLLKDAAYHGYLEYYDYFQRLAADADARGLGLARFLDELRPNLGKYERMPELAILRDSQPGVQLLTIHMAKGLEFPVVIVANAGNTGRPAREGQEPYYLSERYGLTLRVTKKGNYFYRIGEDEAKRKEEAELKRLLYVAATRAKSHLVLSGCHNRNNRSRPDAMLNLLLSGMGWSPHSGETEGAALGAAPSTEADTPETAIEMIPQIAEAELQKLHAPRAAGRIEEIVSSYAQAEVIRRDPPRNDWTASELEELCRRADAEHRAGTLLPAAAADSLVDEIDAEALFGTLCHSVLERVVSPGFLERHPDWRTDFPLELLPSRILRRLPEESLRLLLANAAAFAEGFLTSGLGREALRDESRRSEESFLFQVEVDGRAHVVRGSFDLLFQRGEECVIVDFKTDRERFDGRYGTQLLVYRLAAQALLERPVAAFLFYLRDRSAVESGAGDEILLSDAIRTASAALLSRVDADRDGGYYAGETEEAAE